MASDARVRADLGNAVRVRLLDRIEDRARSLKPARAVLGIVALPLYALGWLVGIIVRAVWWVLAWAWSAAVVGWREGRGVKG